MDWLSSRVDDETLIIVLACDQIIKCSCLRHTREEIHIKEDIKSPPRRYHKQHMSAQTSSLPVPKE